MAIGPFQIFLILLIVILLFGTKKLRNVGSDLGGAIRSFHCRPRRNGDCATIPVPVATSSAVILDSNPARSKACFRYQFPDPKERS